MSAPKKKLTIAECELSPWAALMEGDKILTAKGMPWEIVTMEIDGRPLPAWKNVSASTQQDTRQRERRAHTQSPPTFRSYLIPKFQEFASREFLSSPLPMPCDFYARERLTYKQVFERALEYAAWMRSQGVVVGDRVAIGGRNSTG